ncbi:MAG: methylthioribulose 1-phosphate dehydratase [Deltaproteobacteria bacterium]|nr:methylthioribulose 1-phosphate dehydratase [Deltaproteobacteria bacterium]MBK8719247.1 methylthioribulose 1-phosphate dehydratase [Deltaproteobacteria bacterium]
MASIGAAAYASLTKIALAENAIALPAAHTRPHVTARERSFESTRATWERRGECRIDTALGVSRASARIADLHCGDGETRPDGAQTGRRQLCGPLLDCRSRGVHASPVHVSDATDIAELVCALCRQFYDLGWVSGTGGGISIKGDDGIYMAPSGVQKERIAAADVFVLDAARLERAEVVRAPADLRLRISECQPLFYAAYRERGAGAVLHSHSLWPVLAARLASPHGGAGVLRLQGFEMLKGLRGKGCFDEVVIPIIPNTARESELTESLTAALRRHADVDAVIVAGHGIYVWGRDWVEAKTQAECLDWLCHATVECSRLPIAVTSAGASERVAS